MLLSKAGGSKTTVTLKLGPKPKEPEDFPCCLCVSMSQEGLLPLYDSLADAPRGDRGVAHEQCANIVPETWVDEYEIDELSAEGTRRKIRAVFGVDGIVKDRWNLVSPIIIPLVDAFNSHIHIRNVQLARRRNRRLMVLPYSAPRGSVLKLSMYRVQETARIMVLSMRFCERLKRTSSSCNRRVTL
jgi:hypothetical protein